MGELAEQGNDCKVILCDNAIYVVSKDSDTVFMWDRHGVWYSKTGINGTYVRFDPWKEIMRR